MSDIPTWEPAGPGMIKCISGGGYVRKTDHDAEIARLEAEVERLKGNYYIGRASFLEEQVATLRASLAAAEKRVQKLRDIIGDCACSQCKQIRQILGG